VGSSRTSTTTSRFFRLITVALFGAAALLASCQNGKIPDEDSYAAQLYLKRCGQCHQPYNPSLMTSTMWAAQVDLMQERMKQTGLAPLTSDERKAILDYLSSNAGKQ
jgi:mono/diheme cytochrome c family protein